MNNPFKRKKMTVFHPDSPGMKVVVYRNWFQRKILSDKFATLRETIKYHERLTIEHYNRYVPTTEIK